MRERLIFLTFMMGAQKCTVLGPTGELKNLLKPVASALVASAALVAVDCARRCEMVLICWRRTGWRKLFCTARRPKRADMMVEVDGKEEVEARIVLDSLCRLCRVGRG